MSIFKKGILTVIVLVICILFGVITSAKAIDSRKSDEYMDLGMEYIIKENYYEARNSLDKSVNINPKNNEAKELLYIMEDYIQALTLYRIGEYDMAMECVRKLESNSKSNIIGEKIDEIEEACNVNLQVYREIDDLDEIVEEYISNDKVDEALEIVTKFDAIEQLFSEEYREKIGDLTGKVRSYDK